MTALPDAVLIARGKYATLGSEFRKADRVRMEQMHVMEHARIKSMQAFSHQNKQDFDNALGQLAVIQNAAETAYEAIKEMQEKREAMNAIKNEAWGKDDE